MKPLFSIERTRNLILAAGALIVLIVVGLLFFGHWGRRALLQDLPRRLGADIQLQANQFDYTQSRRGKTLFRIHAERAEQRRKSGETMLHHVRIEFFNPKGEREDTIRGDQFAYNQSTGRAVAQGEVEIDVASPSAAHADSPSIRIRTSGLTFDQKSEVATTNQHLDFLLPQGDGSATGAVYDAAYGKLTLDADVRMHVKQQQTPVNVEADHAEMDRASQTAILQSMRLRYASGSATGGLANILFRADGSIAQLHATDGVQLETVSGAVAQSQEATFQFNAKSQPSMGDMDGDARFRMHREEQELNGSSPRAHLLFDSAGSLQSVRMLDGAQLADEETRLSDRKKTTEFSRQWRSQTATLQFAPAQADLSHQQSADRRLLLRQIDGEGSVTVTSSTRSGAQPAQCSTLAADRVRALFSAGGTLTRTLGSGHVRYSQITGDSAHWASRWTSTSETLDARLEDGNAKHTAHGQAAPASSGKSELAAGAAQIESILQTGHVQIVASRAASDDHAAPTTVHADAAQSIYDGASGILHLTGLRNQPPSLRGDDFSLTADSIHLDRQHENADADENVQATWFEPAPTHSAQAPAHAHDAQTPVHIHAERGSWVGASEQLTFTSPVSGQVHLWQAANAITAPQIVLNRAQQTLDARAESPARPVVTVLAETPRSDPDAGRRRTHKQENSVHLLRLTSGSVHESFAEQLAVFSSAPLAQVTVDTSTPDGEAQIQSDTVRVVLRSGSAAGVASGRASGLATTGISSVDRMICTGHVRFRAPGRTGTGDTLRYTSEDATATLLGSAEHKPQLSDATRGSVSGRQIQLHLTDNSVQITDAAGVTTSARPHR